MYLSKLELFGFKSFADKTKLKFNEGIACVIGPNGSGKSNIVDAIRWVLGEQRVSILRGDKMESIIFNGSLKRKPQGVAEVSLTIENNKNILDSTFTDVVISRRLYRDGESQYLLNKTPCRLKDITNLFMDTGMNANSYSVIELKMIESIISENPEERRILFEEAAGVTKYKARRKSAIRKLTATKSDMSRISDMISEISRTVNSLSRQVGKARRYLKYQEELKNKETDVARYKFNHLQDEIRPLEKQLKEISLIKEDTSHQITLEEALLEDYKQEILQFEQNLSTINKEIYNYDKEIQLMQEEDAVSRTRIDSLLETKKRNVNDIREFGERRQALQKRLQEHSDDIKNIAATIESVEKNYKDIYGKYESESKIQKSKKEAIEVLDTQYKKLFESLTQKKEVYQNKSYKLKWSDEQKRTITHEIEKLKEENKYLYQKIKEISERKDKQQEIKNQTDHTIQNLTSEIDTVQNNIEQLKNKFQAVSSQEETIQSKISFFEHIITNYEGHAKSTKYLMLNKDKITGIFGPLSDFISVDNKYKNAVEIGLGAALNYVVVKDTDVAQNIIEICKKDNLGRITLLPLDRLQELSVDESNPSFPYPVLSKLIDCPEEYRRIFDILLNDVAFVDTLAEAINASNQYPNYRFVTENGEFVNFNREISGGQKIDDDVSLIGRQKQLSNLHQDLDNLSSQKRKLETNIEELLKTKNILNENLDNLTAESEKIQNILLELIRELDKYEFSRSKISELNDAKKQEIESLIEQMSTLKSDLNNQADEVSELQKQLDKIEEEKNSKSAQYEKELESVLLLDKEVQEIKLNLVNEQNRYQNKSLEMERITQSIQEMEDLSQKRNKENIDIANEVDKLSAEKEERTERKNRIYEKRDAKEEEKENFEVSYHEIKDKILNLENQIKKYRKQHDSTLERTRQLELNIQENQMKSDAIKDRIREEYHVDISIGIPFEGLQVDTVEEEIESLKYKIKQLGQVNPLAVSEYEKESERLEFYKNQYEDLNQAVESLQQTIEKINKTARKQFRETFDKIKTNFETVFHNFFKNGEGTLNLEEGVDPLEANIDIMVRPKGKRLQTLNLLSGGEKTLTAISLLFAIYLVKPSPFCILDEIDAPLDDVNITRFTDALKEFAKSTQFIIITHNKRTMEAADTLYGVTMQEEGLSKLVSVNFN